MAFGLLSTETVDDYWSLNSRRKVFNQFPNGAAPLMGLLSLLPSEETDKPEFGWWERRFPTQRTATVASGTAPFLNGDGTAFTDGANFVADTEYRVNVLSTAQFKPTHVIEIRSVVITGTTVNIKGLVTEVISATVLKFRPFSAHTAVQNAATENNGLTVAIIGTANAEGARSGQGISSVPTNATNYTQIFRSAFSITRTALKGGLEYDKSGPYKTMAWDNGLRHMIEMEKAMMFGQKHTVLVTDPDTGDQTPEKKTGGIIHFLEQWEIVNSIYRGGTGAAAVTATTDSNKRIIPVNGTLSESDYETYIDRAFTNTNSKNYEKLVLCGGTFLSAVNKLFSQQIVRNAAISNKERGWEFIVHSHTTLRGTVHYKVHPLLDEDPDHKGSAFILDLGNLRYRYLSDSDTTFLKGRQETDRDGRKDEWITECGLELRFPESHMFISGVTGAA